MWDPRSEWSQWILAKSICPIVAKLNEGKKIEKKSQDPLNGPTHGDLEWTTQASPHQLWQVACSDVVDREWSTHGHRRALPHQIRTQILMLETNT